MDRSFIREKFSSRIDKFRLEDFEMDIYLRPLTGLQRAKLADAYKSFQTDGGSSPIATAELQTIEGQCAIIAYALVNEKGERIYKDDEASAIAEEFPASVIDRLIEEILRISTASRAKQDIEALAKNLNPTPSVDSPSA